MQIQTNRFVLREYTPDDQSALLAYHSSPAYGQFYPMGSVTPESTRELLQRFISWAEESPRQNYQLAVAMRGAPVALIGSCGLRNAGYEDGVAEFGMELAPQYWGQYRYAIEIAEAVLRFGFLELGLREVRGVTIDANTRIDKLARRFGFEVIQTRPYGDPDASRGRVTEWNEVQWRLPRERWELVQREDDGE